MGKICDFKITSIFCQLFIFNYYLNTIDAQLQDIFITLFQNGGSCDFNITSTDSFVTVPCVCPNGYEGDFCETDIDACAAGPCHPLVVCTDVPAQLLDTKPFPFECDACPPGMIGDGRTCAGH